MDNGIEFFLCVSGTEKGMEEILPWNYKSHVGLFIKCTLHVHPKAPIIHQTVTQSAWAKNIKYYGTKNKLTDWLSAG